MRSWLWATAHNHAAMLIPATNKKIVGHGVVLSKWENDLLVDSRLYFDMVETLTQLGVMPVPARS